MSPAARNLFLSCVCILAIRVRSISVNQQVHNFVSHPALQTLLISSAGSFLKRRYSLLWGSGVKREVVADTTSRYSSTIARLGLT